MALPPRVKFFLASRRVIVVAVMENVGKIRMPSDGKVVFMDAAGTKIEERAVKRVVARKIPMGHSSRFSTLILGFRFAARDGTISELAEPSIRAIRAQLLATITNDPPGPGPATPVPVDETEDNPSDEDGDEPDPDAGDIVSG